MASPLVRRVLLALFLATSCVGNVFAHAVVKDSTPAVNAVVADQSSLAIRIHFNSRIELKLSSLSLLPAGGDALRLPIDDKSSVDTLLTHADGLKPGDYRIRWQVCSIDGHITRGDIPFTVAAATTH